MTRRLPAPLARQVGARGEIAIRAARPGDAAAIRRLAQLADHAVPAGALLVAASDGEPLVVLSLETGEMLSDPFRVSADLAELLSTRSAQLHSAAA